MPRKRRGVLVDRWSSPTGFVCEEDGVEVEIIGMGEKYSRGSTCHGWKSGSGVI
jgi:hypothetical protein